MSNHHHRGDRRPRYDDDAPPSYGRRPADRPVIASAPKETTFALGDAVNMTGIAIGKIIGFAEVGASWPPLVELLSGGRGWRGDDAVKARAMAQAIANAGRRARA